MVTVLIPLLAISRSTCIATLRQPAFGIVTWHTEGFKQHGEKVLDYHRTNLVRKRKRD